MSRTKQPNPTPSQEAQAKDRGRPPSDQVPVQPHAAIRSVVSVLLVFHLFAVAVAPMTIKVANLGPRPEPPGGGPPPPADTEFQAPPIVQVWGGCSYYLTPLYLNHGYSFFAPDPGPSHLVEFEVARTDGTTISGRFPDLETHWPRLRYHRFKMLADQAPQLVGDLERMQGPEATSDVARAYGSYLLDEYVGTEARLRLISHRLLWPGEVLAGKPLDAPDTYRVLGEEIVRQEPTGDLGRDAGRGASRSAAQEAVQIPAEFSRSSYR